MDFEDKAGDPRPLAEPPEPAKTELKRRESEEHFSQLVAGVRDYAVFLLDREGMVMTWNAGAERIKGYRAEEIIGHHFSRFYPSDAIASGWPAHELEVAATTGRFEDEGWRVRRDGSRFWANVVLTALRDETDQVRGFLKITRDLTARKQAEEKLRLSEERFRLLVEGVRDYAIFMLDPTGRVATWNTGAEALKGYRAAEIIGRHFSTFYTPPDLERDWPAEELRRAEQEGRVEDEGWRVRKDGTRFWANVVITALRDGHGVLQGFAKLTRDLSERKLAQDKERQLLREEAARKAAEEAAEELARQREQLRVTLTSIGDGVVVTDSEGRVTFLNKIAEALTGWTMPEAMGHPLETVFQILHEVTRQPLENPVATALRQRSVVALANHTVLLRRGGGEFPIEDSAAPIITASGKVSGVVLVFRDVSEARRSLETRLYLAAIVESSEDAIIGKTLNGTVASWNMGAQRLYGYSAEEMLGTPLTRLVPPEETEALEKIMSRVKKGERLEHYAVTRLRKDGTKVSVSLSVSPVRDQDERIIGISMVARDITAQKQTQARLLKHSRRFRLLWESAAVMLSHDDPHEMLQGLYAKIAPHLNLDVYVNYVVPEGRDELQLASYSGLVPEDFSGIETLPFGTGISGQAAISQVSTVYSHILTTDDPILGPAASMGLQACVCNPLIVKGSLLGTLAFATRARPEFQPDELEFLHTLSQYVAAAYERMRLVEQLRDADQRKDHFLATLAHELRNPLAPLRNGLQVIKLADVENEPVRQAHSVMERQLSHMVRLVDDLLDMSRISRGKIKLQKVRVDLAEIVQTAVETSRPMLELHRHGLKVLFAEPSLYVDADVTRMAQVLSNLLNNAAKFTPEGGRIVVEALRRGDEAALCVKDNGVGIPQSMIGNVFDVFTQVDRSLERSEGGLGIGLSLVRGLVELHGGRVEVRSEGQDQGTEFIVFLPLAATAEHKAAASANPKDAPKLPQLRILVVDDNKDSAMTLGMMLRMLKQDIEKAYDGRQAIKVAEKYRPDLILMDIGMPLMNGYDACRHIRAQEWGRGMTIVALTGWGQEEDKRQSEEAGFDTHLVKPIDPAALTDLIGQLVRRSPPVA